MTREEIIQELIAGAQAAGGQFITITREHLLIALGVPLETSNESDISGQDGAGVDPAA